MRRRAFLGRIAALSTSRAWAQVPTPAGTHSAEGTIGHSVTDSLGSAFTLGSRKDGSYQTLRNGSHSLGGYGYAQGYLFFQGKVYAFNRETWFRWDGNDQGWKYDVPQDPRNVLLMARNARTGKSELTLQAAVENAQSKDTILVAPGKWKGHIYTANIARSLTIASADETKKRLPGQWYDHQPWEIEIAKNEYLSDGIIRIPSRYSAEALTEIVLVNPVLVGQIQEYGIASAILPILEKPTHLKIIDGLIRHHSNGIHGGPVFTARGCILELDGTRIEDCGNGEGTTHNLYISPLEKLILTNVWSTGANVGHTLKTRTMITRIKGGAFLGQRLNGDSKLNSASFALDFAQGGDVEIDGAVITKDTRSDNPYTLIAHGRECVGETGGHKIDHDGYVDKITLRNSLLLNFARPTQPLCLFLDLACERRAQQWITGVSQDPKRSDAEKHQLIQEYKKVKTGPVVIQNNICAGSGAKEFVAWAKDMGGSDNVVVPLEKIERYVNEKDRMSYRVMAPSKK
jgi:hypothetical protein